MAAGFATHAGLCAEQRELGITVCRGAGSVLLAKQVYQGHRYAAYLECGLEVPVGTTYETSPHLTGRYALYADGQRLKLISPYLQGALYGVSDVQFFDGTENASGPSVGFGLKYYPLGQALYGYADFDFVLLDLSCTQSGRCDNGGGNGGD